MWVRRAVRPPLGRTLHGMQNMNRLLPILTICLAIIALWYIGTVRMNAQWEYDQAERAKIGRAHV